ncbi:MAG: sporulation protein [Oscillospiraceae bacterium]|nr:sporulation protein [Oscillospiraceae bacterium]
MSEPMHKNSIFVIILAITAGVLSLSVNLSPVSAEDTQAGADPEQKLSSVRIVHSDPKISENSQNSEQKHKTQNPEKQECKKVLLDGYTNYESLSAVSYEIITESQKTETVLVSDQSRNDVVISDEPTPSVVSDVQEGYFAFSTYGWGHCVGLSQNGANFYALYGGWNYQDILFHYYPGTVLMNTGTAETEMITVQEVPGNSLQQVAEIVNREMGASFSTEALKAQAVAVYTYIKYYNNDAHDLKGKPDPPQNVIDACASVLGEALYYQDQFAMTMFGASCGGITADSYDIFQMNLPYLRSVSSDYDADYDPHYGDVVYMPIEEVRNRIENAYQIHLSDHPENWIQLIQGNGGYVQQVNIDNQLTVRGDAFRYELDLKSPKFTYICSVPNSDVSSDSESEPEQELELIDAPEVIPQ